LQILIFSSFFNQINNNIMSLEVQIEGSQKKF
jgi:hypothetical protein